LEGADFPQHERVRYAQLQIIQRDKQMSWKLTIRLIELSITATLIAALAFAWHAERSDRAQLATELAAAKQSLTAADTRQHDRDSDLMKTLAALAVQKRTTTTPQQILQALPQEIPLPQPITMGSTNSAPASKSKSQPTDAPLAIIAANPNQKADAPASATAAKPDKPQPQPPPVQPQATIPAADLKPLYDFAIDCNSCQAKLTATQSDLADEKSKSATLTKERDAAIRIAKGGTVLQRVATAAKWLLIGAAAGALAARTTR
jgi:hypothetical protein